MLYFYADVVANSTRLAHKQLTEILAFQTMSSELNALAINQILAFTEAADDELSQELRMLCLDGSSQTVSIHQKCDRDMPDYLPSKT